MDGCSCLGTTCVHLSRVAKVLKEEDTIRCQWRFCLCWWKAVEWLIHLHSHLLWKCSLGHFCMWAEVYIYIYIYKITKLKQQWSFFYGSQLPLVGVCFGWDTLVQIAPVSSDLTKASSSIYASLVEEVVRGDGWQEKLRQWWSGVRLAG